MRGVEGELEGRARLGPALFSTCPAGGGDGKRGGLAAGQKVVVHFQPGA